ncbi:MAG: sulfatase-like hydrolase/transferase [Acidobacteriota bacterium]
MRSYRIGACAVALYLASCDGAPPREGPAAAREPTSLILVTLDTVRASDCSSYGSPELTTPHLDRLSRGGVLVETAYAASDLTNPSHATLLTGLPLSAHGSFTLRAPIAAEIQTLPEILRARGYATAAVVSVHHLAGELSGLAQGFASFDAPTVSVGERATQETIPIFEKAIAALAPPFFAWLHLYDPHMPYAPPAPWSALARPASDLALPIVPPIDELEKAAHVPFPYRDWLATQDLRLLPFAYRAEIAEADLGVARAAALARRKDGKAAIAVVADHGEGFGEHGVYYNHFGLYEETVRVPLCVVAPGRIAAGTLARATLPSADLASRLDALASGAPWTAPAGAPACCSRCASTRTRARPREQEALDYQPKAVPLPQGTRLLTWIATCARPATSPIRSRVRGGSLARAQARDGRRPGARLPRGQGRRSRTGSPGEDQGARLRRALIRGNRISRELVLEPRAARAMLRREVGAVLDHREILDAPQRPTGDRWRDTAS